ncbi:MAG: prolipoprotein diacylglyceryl transferase [Desulfurivibrio sp.]|nr:prolipoprotein diacylglyceryl transferase [Desulfurivibrio sp.]MBU3936608.1 prolipoprotein diacylglyceryl transferase [Pseudomonadota bacterium]MBU4118926.1 prolipoprotein diacylglyceryl transferase [Pseudomonadota bacterium]
MLPYPEIDPVLLHLGPLQVRWYGLMYVLGFIASYLLVRHQIRRYNLTVLAKHFENLNLVLIISLVLGARLGYVLFYNPGYYLENPQDILATWQGGMSFHGALIGMLLGGLVFCRVTGLPFWQSADVYIITTPIGLGLGRIGNFINGELYGRMSDVPWAMVFPAGGPIPRHPSQLYEAFLEGLILFSLLWLLKNRYWQRRWPAGSLLALFLLFYGLFRTVVELFRQPDAQLGFLFNVLTMGQLLSSLMIATGLLILFFRRKNTGVA